MPRLRTEVAKVATFSTLPLAEQSRIVAKVNDPMALCHYWQVLSVSKTLADIV